MPRTNPRWVLRARPTGMVKESDFEWQEVPAPEPGEGEALVEVDYLAFDPAMRGWIEDRRSYVPPVALGEVMRATGVGHVVESKSSDFAVGDLVQGMFGWQRYAIASRKGIVPASRVPTGMPATWPLGVCGTTGITAYFGMLDIGRPKEGEVVVVSGAAGATGSVAGQIAKLHGCRVIGIAGGEAKCRWLLDEAHFDAAIDYKREDVGKRLRELCPKGLNVYFDNVGGPILEAAIANLAKNARIVLCGGIAGYNDATPGPGPKNLMNLVVTRSRMEGFIVLDYLPRFAEAGTALATWVREGRIAHAEDVQHGLENAPKTLLRLFEGKNLGKQLLDLRRVPG